MTKRAKKSKKKNAAKQAANRSRADVIKPYRFQKGQSGNPNGRPPLVRTLSSLVRNQSIELAYDEDGKVMLDHEGKPLTRINAMLLATWDDAILRHDNQAREFLANRGWGKLPQTYVNLQESFDAYLTERGTNTGQLLTGDAGLSAILTAARIRGLIHSLPEGITTESSTNGNGTGANGVHHQDSASDSSSLPDKK